MIIFISILILISVCFLICPAEIGVLSFQQSLPCGPHPSSNRCCNAWISLVKKVINSRYDGVSSPPYNVWFKGLPFITRLSALTRKEILFKNEYLVKRIIQFWSVGWELQMCLCARTRVCVGISRMCGVMYIVVGNGHGDPRSNSGQGSCNSHSANTFGIGLNPAIHSPAVSK